MLEENAVSIMFWVVLGCQVEEGFEGCDGFFGLWSRYDVISHVFSDFVSHINGHWRSLSKSGAVDSKSRLLAEEVSKKSERRSRHQKPALTDTG